MERTGRENEGSLCGLKKAPPEALLDVSIALNASEPSVQMKMKHRIIPQISPSRRLVWIGLKSEGPLALLLAQLPPETAHEPLAGPKISEESRLPLAGENEEPICAR